MSAIKPYPQSPRRHVPGSIARPPYVGLGDVPETYDGSHVQTPETIAAMEEAGRIACGAMHAAGEAVAPGVTTDEIDRIAHEYMCDHGAGLSGTKPTPLLAARLDKAVELWEADHRRAVIIASGGQGADEAVSEAEAMRMYLVEERGVPADAVIEEDRSTTTMENLRNSKAIMDARSGAGAYRAAVVTSDYHVFRTAEYAHKIGLAADGVGSRTARYFWPTAFIREYVAVSNAHRWPFVVIFVFWLPFAAIALFQL